MDRSHTEENPAPWGREPALTRRLLHNGISNGKCLFFCFDIWHSIHLGIGKSWVSSGIMLLQAIIPGGSVDDRIAEIGRGYRLYCKEHHIDPIIKKVDIFTFGGRGNVERNGAWNKAAITSNFMRFLEDYCDQHDDLIQGDERLKIFVSYLHVVGSCYSLFVNCMAKCVCSIVFDYIPFYSRDMMKYP